MSASHLDWQFACLFVPLTDDFSFGLAFVDQALVVMQIIVLSFKYNLALLNLCTLAARLSSMICFCPQTSK